MNIVDIFALFEILVTTMFDEKVALFNVLRASSVIIWWRKVYLTLNNHLNLSDLLIL